MSEDTAVADVTGYVTNVAAMAGLTGLLIDVTQTPTVRVRVQTPSARYGLANQLIDGPVVREVYQEPGGRVEHLSGPSRLNRQVRVALYGPIR